ncbi:MAG: PhoH family protein [Victivallaceae bacterium]|nr:PhoH family protein [Victivallaceae bacterium]
MVKTFVLDTNVLLHSANSIEAFQENDVIVPMAVVEELDRFKKNQDELGRNARSAIRKLDSLREIGNLRSGVPLSKISAVASGRLFVLTAASLDSELGEEMRNVFHSDLGADSPDNRILRVAVALDRSSRKKVVFISKDINLRLKADALGLTVMDFEREKVDCDALYTGFVEVEVPGRVIDLLFGEGGVEPPEGVSPIANEFLVLKDASSGKHTALARFHGEDGLLHPLDPRGEAVWNITSRNMAQRMALDVLIDPAIKLVTLVGGAGTGKTLLALAAALSATLNEKLYEKILISRPIIPLGNDIGFLPGSKDAKLNNWMQPIFDNLEYLLQTTDSGNGNGKGKHSPSRPTAESLISSRRIELEALTYIRGRSIPRQFVIVDEAQNLTPHEVKTIISRAGEDTKMVLTGDPRQIDNPYLDASSNGLTYAAERLKGQPLHGHVTLSKSERSQLAALAARLL